MLTCHASDLDRTARMSHHPRGVLTLGPSRKRKEMEAVFTAKHSAPPLTAVVTPASPKAAEPALSNRLLAGYMAYEYLTKGTLLGQKWDPARAEAASVSNGLTDWKRSKPGKSLHAEAEPSGKIKQQQKHSYAEVASLLKGDGAHVPGIVNPTELARWLEM